MASSSKPKKDETPEEIMARKRMIVGGAHAGNGLDMTPGTEIMMNADGTNGFSIGGDPSDQYYWNEKTGDYRSNGGGIARIAEIPQAQAAAPAPSGGGGKPPPKKKKKPKDKIIYPDGEVIDTNPGGGGYAAWQAPMTNYQPVTPGTHLNPLTDPANWMHTPDPQFGILNNPGLYVNNPRPKGVI